MSRSKSSVKELCELPIIEKFPLERSFWEKIRIKQIFLGFCCFIGLVLLSIVLLKKEAPVHENLYYLKGGLPNFVGRQKYLDLLHKELVKGKTDFSHSAKMRVLWGKGGFGKSELAIEFGNRHISDFSLIWSFCCDSEENIYQSYHHLAEKLGLIASKGNFEEIKRKVHFYLENHSFERPWLLIFDNVENELIDYPQRGGVILVTSQKKILNPQFLIEVEPFSEEESIELLEKISHEKRGSAMRELAHDLEGIPLLLNYAAHYIKATPGCNAEDYHQLFSSHISEKEGPLWKQVDINKRYFKSLSASWQFPLKSLEKEHPLALQWLYVCSYLYPEHICEEWVDDWLLENTSDKLVKMEKRELLKALQTYGIIRYESETKTFSLHRFFQHMIRESRKDQLQEDLRQTVLLLAKHATDYMFSESSSWKKGQLWYLHACEVRKWLVSSPTLDERAQEAIFYDGIGEWCVFNELFLEGLNSFIKALELRRLVFKEDSPEIARTHQCIAWSYLKLARYSEGIEACEKAEKIQSHFVGEAALDYGNLLNCKGNIWYRLGENEKAFKCHQQALAIRLENIQASTVDIEKNLPSLISYINEQGKKCASLKKQGRNREALQLHEKVIDIGRSLGNSAVYFEKDQPAKAHEYIKNEIKIYKENCGKNHPLYIWTLESRARNYIQLKQYKKALDIYRQTFKLNVSVRGKEHGDVAQSLAGIGWCHFHLKKYQLAKRDFKKAIHMGKTHRTENAAVVLVSYNGLGWSHLKEGRVKKGFKYLTKQLGLSAQTYHNTPKMHMTLEDFQKALKEAQQLPGNAEIVAQAAAFAYKISKETVGQDHPLTRGLMTAGQSGF